VPPCYLFFSPCGVPISNLKHFSNLGSRRLVSDQRDHKAKLSFLNNASTFQSCLQLNLSKQVVVGPRPDDGSHERQPWLAMKRNTLMGEKFNFFFGSALQALLKTLVCAFAYEVFKSACKIY